VLFTIEIGNYSIGMLYSGDAMKRPTPSTAAKTTSHSFHAIFPHRMGTAALLEHLRIPAARSAEARIEEGAYRAYSAFSALLSDDACGLTGVGELRKISVTKV
jgi:hypothetical protein